MSDTRRIVLIASGVSLLAVVLVPLVVCLAMMAGGIGMSPDGAMHGTPWLGALAVVIVLIGGILLLRAGVRRQ